MLFFCDKGQFIDFIIQKFKKIADKTLLFAELRTLLDKRGILQESIGKVKYAGIGLKLM